MARESPASWDTLKGVISVLDLESVRNKTTMCVCVLPFLHIQV